MQTEGNGICTYCGERTLTGSERPEHPIPRALGSSLEVRTACDPCNTWAGREIDEPFLRDDFILMLRSVHDVRDPRRPRWIPSPFQRGQTVEGVEIVTDADWNPRILNGRIVEGPGDGEFHIIAGDEEEYQRLLRKLEQRAAAQGKSLEYGDPRFEEVSPQVTGRIEVAPWRLRRAAAKMALGIASDALPEPWRLSNDAVRLRRWMRDPKALPYDYAPYDRVQGGPFEPLLSAPREN